MSKFVIRVPHNERIEYREMCTCSLKKVCWNKRMKKKNNKIHENNVRTKTQATPIWNCLNSNGRYICISGIIVWLIEGCYNMNIHCSVHLLFLLKFTASFHGQHGKARRIESILSIFSFQNSRTHHFITFGHDFVSLCAFITCTQMECQSCTRW